MNFDFIKKCCRDKELCEIYSDVSDNDKFYVGYILAYDEQFLMIAQIDKYGHYDGISCILARDIMRIQVKTVYLKTILKLMQYYNTDVKTASFEDFSFGNLMEFVKINRKICEIELADSARADVVGYVKKYNPKKHTVIVSLISVDGEYDGESEVDCEYISSLTYDSKDTKKIEILAQK